MPGLKSLAQQKASSTANASASQASQLSQLFVMLQTPEEVVRNSQLVTVPNALQAALAKLAGAAVNGTRVTLPAVMQAELTSYLKQAVNGSRDVLVPAGSTGVVFSPQVLAAIQAGGA